MNEGIKKMKQLYSGQAGKSRMQKVKERMTDERTIRQGQEINHKEKKGKDEKFMLQ